jgi:putative membrane protein insertion efficiency factor
VLRGFFLFLINIYQKYKFTSPSCRFYPSCSSYAKLQFFHNNPVKAIWFTIFRILKCNQLFDGGFDYPIVRIDFSKKVVKTGKVIRVKFWFVPIDKDKFYTIKAI